MSIDKAIGVFDSGIGGLTVLKEIIKHLPCEDTIYLGDTARVPYGTKSPETVTRYSLEIADFLVSKGIKMLVVACNTASAFALSILREKLDIPVIGVIEPGARRAISATETGRIGIIGTEGTIKSNSYVDSINSLCRGNVSPVIPHGHKGHDRYFKIEINGIDKFAICTKACPLFVPLVEEGWIDNEVAFLTVRNYLKGLKREKIDILVLGCTHYPLLRNQISKVMGRNVRLIDSGEETALEVRRVLSKEGLLKEEGTGKRTFYVTDTPERFVSVGLRFLGGGLDYAERVEIS